jgi:ABC-type methionine transport system permease subunit
MYTCLHVGKGKGGKGLMGGGGHGEIGIHTTYSEFELYVFTLRSTLYIYPEVLQNCMFT